MARRRFDGAITTPEDSGEISDSSVEPAPERPARPVLIELSAAILIVGGIAALLSVAGSLLSPGDPAATPAPIVALVLLLDVLQVVVGILIRIGRAWVVAINVVAITLFLELTALPSAFAIIFVVLDTIVLFALVRYRDWFDWRSPVAADVERRT